MRKIAMMLMGIIAIFLIGIKDVFASELNYTNDYGVVLTKEEYEIISKLYWDGYQKFMTNEDYENFKSLNAKNDNIEIKEVKYNGNSLAKSDYFNDSSRNLKIAKTCSDNCFISVTLTWNKQPNIKSYDVIGAYFDGTTLQNTPKTIIISSGNQQIVHDLKSSSNGIGSSFLLPSGTGIIINQTYQVARQGHIYASYQHAKSRSTLAISKDYVFSKSGYGKVFGFSALSRGYYDAMNGVDVSL